MDANSLLNFAVSVGEVMLKNGGETYRVEDTMNRILSVSKEHNPQVFITPTGIFASIDTSKGTLTKIRRIPGLDINLEKIAMANALSRAFVANQISLEDGFTKLEEIEALKDFPEKLIIFIYGVICLSFCALYSGTVLDSAVAFIIGLLFGTLTRFLNSKRIPSFLNSLIRCVFVSVLSVMSHLAIPSVNYAIVLTSTILPLVPGVATTNAIRDVMNGDFLSGASRIVEAVVTAVSVATGVVLVLALFKLQGGV